MATGNPGMLSPYEQGADAARRGYKWEQIYDQPGEQREAREYRDGYFNTLDAIYEQLLKSKDKK